MRRALLAALLMLSASAPAAAQQRIVVDGTLGTSFATTVTAPAVSGSVGLRLSPDLLVFGETGWMRSIILREFDDLVSSTVADFNAQYGRQLEFHYRMPALYAVAGARLHSGRPAAKARPFVEARAGIAHASISADTAGSQGQFFAYDLDGNQVDLATYRIGYTKAIAGLGAGLSLSITRRQHVDVVYRYDRIRDFGSNAGRVHSLGVRVGAAF